MLLAHLAAMPGVAAKLKLAVGTGLTFILMLHSGTTLAGDAAATHKVVGQAIQLQNIKNVPTLGNTEVVPTQTLPWVPQGGYSNTFDFGQCTYWAATNFNVTWAGDAGDWLANAQDAGVKTSSVPSVGAVVVYGGDGVEYSGVGHVGIVINVKPGQYTVSEMNYAGENTVDERTVAWPDPHVLGFIPVQALSSNK